MSCRALFLAFLIHLHFSDRENPAVASCKRGVANGLSRGVRPRLDGRMPSTFASYARTLDAGSTTLTWCQRAELQTVQ